MATTLPRLTVVWATAKHVGQAMTTAGYEGSTATGDG